MKLIQTGPRNARVVFVGEAPGKNEEEQGVPFVGGSGVLLDKFLGRVGINRRDIFITNICHVRPPKNDFKWFLKNKEGQKHLLLGMIQLKKDLEAIKPHLVVALGAQPLKTLTGNEGIDKWRGSVLECKLVPGLKVIGTYHPAYILRVWDYHAVLHFDLLRIAREQHYPEIRRPHRDLILDPPLEQREALRTELSKAEWLACDIECFQRPDGSWALACVGFSDKPSRAITIPIRSAEDKRYVAEILASDAKKIFQNGNNFDIPVLENEGIEVRNYEWDTMLGMHAIYPEASSGGDELAALEGKKRQSALARGLAFQTSIFTDEPYYKDDGKLWKESGDLETFWRYNARDAAVTREIFDKQRKEIAEFGVTEVMNHSMALTKPLMAATRRGILINKKVHAELEEQYKQEIENLQRFLDKAAGGPINVKSNKQMTDLLYNRLGMPLKLSKKSGNPTANKDTLVELAASNPHPVLMTVLEIRKRRDMIERYLNTPFDSDGRMRCSFDIAGTRSGRLSSRRSVFGSGTNLQNQPPEIRKMFVPSEGMVFVYRDYSQAEARMVAYLARCQALIELFEDPSRDVHTENAARIFNKDPKDVDRKVERYLAKRVVHACNYGMAARRLMQVVNEDAHITGVRINLQDAKSLVDRYFLLFPEIRQNFWREVEDELRHTRTLTTPFGRKRQFFGRWDDKLLREAYSYIPQSVVGDLTCKALVAIYHRVPSAHVLLNVHDSVLVECPETDAEQVAREMAKCMNISIPLLQGEVFIPTDCQIGYNWATKSDSNPNGLEEVDW